MIWILFFRKNAGRDDSSLVNLNSHNHHHASKEKLLVTLLLAASFAVVGF